jgi:parvulin-like peptidyl-prolyl isomerase
MKGLALFVAAVLLGAATGELLCGWRAFRNLAGLVTGRGALVKVANGKGIYASDLGGDEEVTAADAMLAENLRRAAVLERPHQDRVNRELGLVKAQFGNDQAFDHALAINRFSLWSLHEAITDQLRGWQWLERQVASTRAVTEEECRKFYDGHPDLFAQPVRYRASHLFLAAHAKTAPEVVAEKEAAIAELASRLQKGEPLSQLAAESSEDEATRNGGGDLGYFCETRIPAEFMVEVQKLQAGQTSKPFRSHLGFHIVQLTEIKSARVLSFEEARAEISLALANERRAGSVRRIVREISAFASR